MEPNAQPPQAVEINGEAWTVIGLERQGHADMYIVERTVGAKSFVRFLDSRTLRPTMELNRWAMPPE